MPIHLLLGAASALAAAHAVHHATHHVALVGPALLAGQAAHHTARHAALAGPAVLAGTTAHHAARHTVHATGRVAHHTARHTANATGHAARHATGHAHRAASHAAAGTSCRQPRSSTLNHGTRHCQPSHQQLQQSHHGQQHQERLEIPHLPHPPHGHSSDEDRTPRPNTGVPAQYVAASSGSVLGVTAANGKSIVRRKRDTRQQSQRYCTVYTLPVSEEDEFKATGPPRRSLLKKIFRRLKATCVCWTCRNQGDDDELMLPG